VTTHAAADTAAARARQAADHAVGGGVADEGAADEGAAAVRGSLEEVRTAADDILAFAADLDEAGLSMLPVTDRRTYRALRDALTEIGERVGGLPPDLLARHPGVDWRGWAGLREVVSQRHFELELHRLRPAVAEELPALLAAVEAELAYQGGERMDGQASGAG
jgi:uncharacterized protein with HEPN domain